MNYKVVIPTAGKSEQLSGLLSQINPALASIGNKPVISYIIEKFPVQTPIVVPLGYKAEQVKDFLTMAYPERPFEFIEVQNFDGEGSGLGHTLLSCKHSLQCPFIFCASDTLVDDDIPAPDHNWMGYMNHKDTQPYRCIKINDQGHVIDISAKGTQNKELKPYIGLAGIYNHQLFWQSLEKADDQAILIGESYGLRALINDQITAKEFSWHDTGNEKVLEQTRRIMTHNAPVILDKPDEAIWFVNSKVIKFSLNESFIKNRVKRAEKLLPYIPEILASSKNMYMYAKVPGTEMSRIANGPLFEDFLNNMKGFWTPHALSPEQEKNFKQNTHAFYYDKTLQRIESYFKTFEQTDRSHIINGRPCPTIHDLFKQVDWDDLATGTPVRFHGDLHFENILVTNNPNSPFIMLDWRQDFAGDLDIGDIYYDLAKLAHGFIISHQLIHENLFLVEKENDIVTYEFLRKNSQIECLESLKKWIEANNYNYKKTMILTALIFLNIAVLHTYPYSKLLFYLGKDMLNKHINMKETTE